MTADEGRFKLSSLFLKISPLAVKGVVIVDEGRIKVSAAGQALEDEVELRIKGMKPVTEEEKERRTSTPPPEDKEREGGFKLGQEELGVVVAHHGSRVIVERVQRGSGGLDERVSCGITPLLKQKGLLTGDKVTFCESLEGDAVATNNTAGRKGIVVERLDRKTLLERPAKAFSDVDMSDLAALAGGQALAAGGGSKLMCANVDQMLIVIAARPLTPPLMIDSHIVAAIDSGIEPVIVLNKCDLLDQPAVGQHADGQNCTWGELLPDLEVYSKLKYRGECCLNLVNDSVDGPDL